MPTRIVGTSISWAHVCRATDLLGHHTERSLAVSIALLMAQATAEFITRRQLGELLNDLNSIDHRARR